jgi:hypothetical protein
MAYAERYMSTPFDTQTGFTGLTSIGTPLQTLCRPGFFLIEVGTTFGRGSALTHAR